MKRALLAMAAICLIAAGCTPSSGAAASTNAPSNTTSASTLTVFAAASLAGPFNELGSLYTKKYPGRTVQFSFDGSATLVDQLASGARADVFASADEVTMTRAQRANVVDDNPAFFASNTLVLIVEPGNPQRITGLDRSLDDKRLVICAPGVPCGSATATLAGNLGITLKPVSEETKVTDVRGKVESGEADAGLVYATDAQASGAKVTTILVPGADRVVNRYPIARTSTSTQATAADGFIALVASSEGQAVLAKYGFGAP